jgi:DUF4097 and DUF4098 domain-containing protein YvlB
MLACVIVLAACDFAYPAVEGRFDRTLNVTGMVDLDVSTGSGSIDVRAGGSAVVQIHGIIRARDDWKSTAQDKIRHLTENPPIEQSGNVIRIGRIDNAAYRNNVSISYEIIVPPETKIRSQTGSGSEKVEGIRGAVDAVTGSGSITLTDIGSDVVAHTGSGGITIEQVSGRVEARTGSGSIRAEEIAGSIKASTGSGGIKLGQISAERGGTRDVEVNTGSGSIELIGIDGSLRAVTHSGGIRASGNPGGDWELNASSGSITLELSSNVAFDLDAHSSSGSIRIDQPVTVTGTASRHELRGKVGGGGNLIEARTSSGNITIR